MDARAFFNQAALAAVESEIVRLRTELSYRQACELPETEVRDIVVAGREVQLTTFRQRAPTSSNGDILVAVQVARFGLGGIVSYQTERGLIFSPSAAPRDATGPELTGSPVQ
jgi:hypothetical protein